MAIKVFYQHLTEAARVAIDAAFSDSLFMNDEETGERMFRPETQAQSYLAMKFARVASYTDSYRLNAVLNTDDLDVAWAALQNIEPSFDEDEYPDEFNSPPKRASTSWVDGPLVTQFLFDESKHLYRAEGYRSAMKGDILVVENDEGEIVDGYVVTGNGFARIMSLGVRRLLAKSENYYAAA